MFKIAKMLKPPYFVVIFSSLRTSNKDCCVKIAKRMIRLAEEQDGFLGAEETKTDSEIMVSFWLSMESIENWRLNVEHQLYQQYGNEWSTDFNIRIAMVVKDSKYDW